MQTDRFSVAWLLAIVTAAGFYAWVVRLALGGSPLAAFFAGAILAIAIPFVLYSAAFALVFPLGVLNEIVEHGSENPQSPFAEGRLPSQQVQPQSDPDKAF